MAMKQRERKNISEFESMQDILTIHDDAMIWTCFVKEIHRSLINLSCKGMMMYSFNCFFVVSPNKLFHKKSISWWFERQRRLFDVTSILVKIYCVITRLYGELCMYSSDELFQRSQEGYFDVYFPSCEATRETNTKITLEWTQKQFVTRVHTLSNILHDITNVSMTIKMTIFTHRPRVSLVRFSFCWWRHNGLLMTSQWPDNCDSVMYIVKSNSLYVDFIHGDIHGRSCKKLYTRIYMLCIV